MANVFWLCPGAPRTRGSLDETCNRQLTVYLTGIPNHTPAPAAPAASRPNVSASSHGRRKAFSSAIGLGTECAPGADVGSAPAAAGAGVGSLGRCGTFCMDQHPKARAEVGNAALTKATTPLPPPGERVTV